MRQSLTGTVIVPLLMGIPPDPPAAGAESRLGREPVGGGGGALGIGVVGNLLAGDGAAK